MNVPIPCVKVSIPPMNVAIPPMNVAILTHATHDLTKSSLTAPQLSPISNDRNRLCAL